MSNDAAGFAFATDRSVAPPDGAFDAGLRPDPFPDRAASLLPGLLAATRTGLPPASDDELTTTDQPPTRSTSCLLGARENLTGGPTRSPGDARSTRRAASSGQRDSRRSRTPSPGRRGGDVGLVAGDLAPARQTFPPATGATTSPTARPAEEAHPGDDASREPAR